MSSRLVYSRLNELHTRLKPISTLFDIGTNVLHTVTKRIQRTAQKQMAGLTEVHETTLRGSMNYATAHGLGQ
jgi:hypothetical protein